MSFATVMDFLRDRTRAYCLVFQPSQPADMIVLKDLARFCRANESCAVPGDHDKTMMLEGRREVWIRIMQMIKLSPEQQFDLYGGVAPKEQSK